MLLSYTVLTKKKHMNVTFFSSLGEGYRRTIGSRYQRQDQSEALQNNILKVWFVSILSIVTLPLKDV